MNLLCTTFNAISQFESLDRAVGDFEVLYLDRPYDFQIGERELVIWQDERTLVVGASSRLIFLPFRDLHEGISDPPAALAAVENFELLQEGIGIVGAKIYNSPVMWRRAYLKSSLLRISKRFPGLVPSSYMVNGIRCEDDSAGNVDRLVKSGYGIRRAIENRYPRATLLPAGVRFTPPIGYRYVVQDFVRANREVRCYVTIAEDAQCVNAVAMPIGGRECPDWRDSLKADEIECSSIKDSALDRLALELASELGLNFVCFDFLYREEHPYLVDVNPHGSWMWLPENVRKVIDQQVETWIQSIAGAAVASSPALG